jgi:RNA polymerase sigma-70 factor (ECF subfamily)
MSLLPEAPLAEDFEPYALFRKEFGFVPRLFRAQSLLPRALEAEAGIAGSILIKDGALNRIQKECILMTVAAGERNVYCVTAHARMLEALGMPAHRIDRILADHRRAGLPEADAGLLDFALLLGRHPTWVGRRNIEALRGLGFGDRAILEAVLMTALTEFLCTLSFGLGVEPDADPWPLSARGKGTEPPPGDARGPLPRGAKGRPAGVPGGPGAAGGRYLEAADLAPSEFPPFAFFKDRFGFVPNIFKAQTLRPDVLEAEARAVGAVLLTEDVLSRVQKESILLAVSAANLNTYCVAVHCEFLRALGIDPEVSDQIAVDHHRSDLPAADKALLDFALRLARREGGRPGPADVAALRAHGFTDVQILEAVVMTSMTALLNTLQMGLAPEPDVPPLRVFPVEIPAGQGAPETAAPGTAAAGPAAAGPTAAGPAEDPDADLVDRSRRGDLQAFGDLVRRHERRIYGVLAGLTGEREDALDAAQNAFVKAFERLAEFRGQARFSTWLTRIAINEGLELLRSRRDVASLDGLREDEVEEFRPRLVQPWQDDPERQYSRMEMRSLVEAAIKTLPPVYRLPVLLRDVAQMTTDEAAGTLGIGGGTLRTRLLRGRLMVREALAPRFAGRREGGKDA